MPTLAEATAALADMVDTTLRADTSETEAGQLTLSPQKPNSLISVWRTAIPREG
jgi:hypothetical protein